MLRLHAVSFPQEPFAALGKQTCFSLSLPNQVGRILRRDKEQNCALVQLQQDESRLLTLDYDFVCHYVGRVEDD